MKELTSSVDVMVEVEAMWFSTGASGVVNLCSICVLLVYYVAALDVEDKICEMFSVCFSRRDL